MIAKKKTLKLSLQEAIQYYNASSDNGFKALLEQEFGKDFWKPKEVKTLNDVYERLGIKREDVIPYANPVTKQQLSANAFVDIQHISKCLNEDWVEDWSNKSQSKYYPYFEKTARGWAVFSCRYYLWAAHLGFGCYFKDSKTALYAGNTFLKVYKDYLPE